MLHRVPLFIPLLLVILRFSHLGVTVSKGERIFLIITSLLLPLIPVKRILKRVEEVKVRTGALLLLVLLAVSLFAPCFALHAPNKTFPLPECRYLSPLSSSTGGDGERALFPLGTDNFGRCVYSRMVYGSRISLSIGVLAMILAVGIGALWGAIAGYAGGMTDGVLMRIADGFLAFPRLFLLILIVAIWPRPPSVLMVVLLLGLLSWMGVARLVRGQILSLKNREFVLAARQLGASHARILLRHLLPNAAGPIIVDGTLRIGGTILVEAALSYLGLGVQPPTASWGNMIAGGKDVLLDGWWITTFPGLAIVLTVMSFFLIGEGLRDITRAGQ